LRAGIRVRLSRRYGSGVTSCCMAGVSPPRFAALFVKAACDGQFDDLDDPPERMPHD